MVNKQKNSILKLNFLIGNNTLEISVFMSAQLIIFCNCNNIMSYKT